MLYLAVWPWPCNQWSYSLLWFCVCIVAHRQRGSTLDFSPTSNMPALQFLDRVDKGSMADKAGLKTGDFVLEVKNKTKNTKQPFLLPPLPLSLLHQHQCGQCANTVTTYGDISSSADQWRECDECHPWAHRQHHQEFWRHAGYEGHHHEASGSGRRGCTHGWHTHTAGQKERWDAAAGVGHTGASGPPQFVEISVDLLGWVMLEIYILATKRVTCGPHGKGFREKGSIAQPHTQ